MFTPVTRVRTAALALVVNALLVVPAFGWTPAGHMSVAFVAYDALRPATRTRVDALLRLNPQFPIWSKQVASLPAADRGRAIFMLAATWADAIKSRSEYTDVDPAHRFRPKGPKSALNIGYADQFRHQYWHFIDLPFATTPSLSLPSVPTPNAQERITLFLNTLRSTAPDPVKSYDLTWLLHLVGDIHQPLHGSTRVTPTARGRDGDDGGNEVMVCKNTNCTKTGTLHGFWDESIGSDESLRATSTVGRTLPPANATAAAILDPAAWAKESLELSKTEVYRRPIGPPV